MQIEQHIKDSELRYRRLFEATQDGILILDAETGMIEDVNPYMMKMLGYSRDEFVKKKLWEVGAFKDVNASKDAFENLQYKEYIRYENLPLKTKHGRMIEVEFVSNVYFAGDEKVIQCNIRDITEHKRIITALQENEKKYFSLLDQSSDGIFIIDLSGNILTVNKAMCRELGFSQEEFLAMKIWTIFPGQYLDQYRESLTKILAGESFERAGEYEVQGKYRKKHYVEIFSTPHYNNRDMIGFQGIARDITARKRAEEALQESEARNRRLVEHLPTVVYTNAVGDAGSTLYVSPQIESLLGYTPQEWLADPKLWSKTLHPEDRQRVLARVAATDQSQEPYDIEYRMIARNGRLVWVQDQITLMNDLGGSGHLWQGTMLDITERKQAGQALQESEQRFRSLVENNSDAITLLDAQGIAIYDSPAAPGMLGYAPEDWIGRDVFELIHPDDLPRMQGLFQKLVETPGARVNHTFRLRHKSGSWLWIEMVATNLLAEPAVQAIVLNYHDITERKRAEETLHESEERFKNAFQYSAIGMALVSLEGKWLKVNSILCSIVGYSEEELLTKTFQDITHPDDLSSDLGYLNQVLAGEIASYTMEKRYFHRDGKTVSVLLAVALARDSAGRPLYFISQVVDITDRKQAEFEIRQRLSELELLYQSGLVFSQLLTPKDIAEKIIGLLKQKMDWHHTAIRLYHPETKTLELLAFNLPNLKSGEEHSATEKRFKTMQRFDQGLSGWVVLHGQTVRSDDVNVDPRYFETFSDVHSGLYVPIKVADRVIGVISIESETRRAFSESDERLVGTLATQAAIAIDNAELFESQQHSNSELIQAYDATIEGWSRALDLRDKETDGHSQRVMEMTVNLARAFDFGEAEMMQVRWGSLLHDIGKMGVPDGILLKAGPLSEEEWVAMKKHPTFAYELLTPIHYLQLALDIPYCHHEKWDGTGYPRGLKGNQIPPTARIFAVVDVWDALNSDRPYRPRWPEEKIREHIRALAGTHFDPQVVDRFLQVVE